MKNELGEFPILIAHTGKLDGGRWVLDSEELIIGRGKDCGLIVPDRQVSRHHARIRRTERGYLLEDLGSKNGTHLNGTEVTEGVLLQDGDEIQIALALKLVYVGIEATIPLKSADLSQLGLGRLRMDPQAHRVWLGEAEIEPPLSPPQFRLLTLMYENPDRVVTREQIVEGVWPDSAGEGVSEQAIDALVRRLRERLSEVDPDHRYVTTVRGHGFRLNNPV
ncbi:MAG: FHA domain-containing protein [Anaerolineales bacterium]